MAFDADQTLKNIFFEAMRGFSAADPEEYLEDGRIDVNGRYEMGRTPLMMAFHYSRHLDRAEAIRLLLAAPALDLDATCAERKTALMYAVEAGNNTGAIAILRRSTNSLNAQDRNGETALMKAARLNNYILAAGLVQWGAKTGIVNNAGQTAGDIAREAGALSLAAEVARDLADLVAEPFSTGSDKPVRPLKPLRLK
jgi:ankyrin repeat domain-containing protein 50